MTPSEREYMEALEQRVLDLERAREPRTSRAALLLTGLLGVVVLSASIPANGLTAVESRLAVLESLIGPGQDSSLEVKAPLRVLGAGGKVLLNVAPNSTAGLINITQITGHPGGILTVNSNGGKTLVSLGVNAEGHGRVATMDAQGKVASVLGEAGLAVMNVEGKQVAGVTRGQGLGRIGIWHNDKWVAELIADQAGNGVVKTYSPSGNTPVVTLGADPQRGNAGALTLMTPTGNVVAAMRGTPDGNAGIISVMNSAGKQVAGLTAGSASGGAVVVANAAGVGLAQMSITSDGRGLVQVFGRTQNPVAVLTQATEYPGGLLQIYNSSTAVANLTVAQGGGGLFQLSSNAGVPTVEAGTLQSGRGMVRVGPQYKCSPVKASTPIIGVPGYEDCLVGSVGEK